MSMDLADNESTLVEIMAWGGQAQAIDWAHDDPDLCSHITITNSYLKQNNLDKHFFHKHLHRIIRLNRCYGDLRLLGKNKRFKFM